MRLILAAVAICCLNLQMAGAQPKTAPSSQASKGTPGSATKAAQGGVKQAPGGSSADNKGNDLFGGDDKDRPKGPTDIRCSQEAQFDVKTRSGVFVGNVKVVDPQFTLTADRLAVKLNKDEEGGGLNEAQAEGNVMIVHVNQPKNPGTQTQGPGVAVAGAQPPGAQPLGAQPLGAQPPGAQPPGAQPQQPVISTGKAERAVYEAKDGSITLTGWPQVSQGPNTHVATAPGVKMVLYRDGRMQTFGSTRTLIQDRTAANKPNSNGPQ